MDGMLNNGKIIKWLGLTPLKKPEIKVELVEVNLISTAPIDYSQIDHMKCDQVGERVKDINSLNLTTVHQTIPNT